MKLSGIPPTPAALNTPAVRPPRAPAIAASSSDCDIYAPDNCVEINVDENPAATPATNTPVADSPPAAVVVAIVVIAVNAIGATYHAATATTTPITPIAICAPVLPKVLVSHRPKLFRKLNPLGSVRLSGLFTT